MKLTTKVICSDLLIKLNDFLDSLLNNLSNNNHDTKYKYCMKCEDCKECKETVKYVKILKTVRVDVSWLYGTKN